MYVRRKVFSVVDDYDFNDVYERAFSEGIDCAVEEYMFSDDDASIGKGAAIGALTAAGLGAGATFAGTGIGKLQNRKLSKLVGKAMAGDAEAAKKLDEYTKYLGEDKGIVNKTKGGSNKLKNWIKDNWKREAQGEEGKIANFFKGKGKVLGAGAGVLGVGAGVGAGINAYRNKKNNEKAFSDGYDYALEYMFSDDSEASVAKGAAIGALTAAGVAGAGYGALAGGQALNKRNGKAYIEALRNAKTKEEEEAAEKLGKKAREGFANKVGWQKAKFDKWVKEAWNREAKEGEGKLANFAKGKGKVLGAGAATLGVGAGVGAGINAYRNRKKD